MAELCVSLRAFAQSLFPNFSRSRAHVACCVSKGKALAPRWFHAPAHLAFLLFCCACCCAAVIKPMMERLHRPSQGGSRELFSTLPRFCRAGHHPPCVMPHLYHLFTAQGHKGCILLAAGGHVLSGHSTHGPACLCVQLGTLEAQGRKSRQLPTDAHRCGHQL